MTNKTAYMFLTCARDPSRYDVLRKVIDNLKSHPEFEKFDSNLIVFDNDSTFGDTKHLLNDTFSHVVHASENYGYWGAINWVLNNYASILDKVEYEYFYLIESDQIHYDWYKFDIVENFLEKNNTIVDSVRMREFFVKEAHLYDKHKPSPESRPWAWQTQHNVYTNEKVTFSQADDEGMMYLTNFTTIPPSMNRIALLRYAFKYLEQLNEFTEVDFSKACHDYNQVTGLLDGGVCHAKLGFDRLVLSSGRSKHSDYFSFGYRNCNVATMEKLKEMKVEVKLNEK